MIKKIITGAMLAFMPMLVMAQVHAASILGTVRNLLNLLIPILITAALVYFIWGVIKYITAKDADAQKDARNRVVQGVIGLFIILSVWGLIGVIQSTSGVGGGGTLTDELIPGIG